MKKLHKALALIMALAMIICFPTAASAAPVDEATIDFSRTGSIDIFKYDLSNAEKDGIWDSSYVSTGVKDEDGVESILGDPTRVSHLNENGDPYGYAIKGVEFSYVKVADIRTYTESEDGTEHVEVLYGIASTEQNNVLLSAIGVSSDERYTPADADGIFYYRSGTLIDGLKTALDTNATAVKNALEQYVRNNNGTAMPETDAYGHSSVSGLPLGLYLLVEARVPETVTESTAPFFISLPMTSVNGGNASDGGTRWIYDITLYPKNMTGIPTLEKTLREAKADTGKNTGSTTDIADGYAHTTTASAGDTVDYQIISTLPSITSSASYLSEYTFVDTLSKGISYKKGDVALEFYKDAAYTDKICTWTEADGKFTVTYDTTENGGSGMTIAMTEAGLSEINTSETVYAGAGMVNSGYSDCTLRITYTATVNSDSSAVCGDAGIDNSVVLTWKRSNTGHYDTLTDDCHLYTYGIDITKRFSDSKGDMSRVEFIAHNDTDGYYLKAELNQNEGVYYITGHVSEEKDATHFIPTKEGKLMIKGIEDDSYTLTEVKTDNSYTLLKNSVQVVIQSKQLDSKSLTASATVDKHNVNMSKDSSSENAFVPFTIINTRGFDLPQTGSYGNWMFPVIGISGLFAAGLGMYFLLRKKKSVSE